MKSRSLVLFGWLLLATPLAVQAQFNYTANSDGTSCTITGYTGSGGAVTIPGTIAGLTVTSIGDFAFFNSASLTSVTIPSGVTSIGMFAFCDCPSLTSVTVPNGVTTIGQSAFNACTSLTSAAIPQSLNTIGQGAFVNCISMTTITVDPQNSTYSSLDGVLFNKAQTTLIQCPNGKGGSYSIPNTVTKIGQDALSGCRSLTSVRIPSGVMSLDSGALGSCFSLTTITIDAQNPSYSSANGVLFNKEQTILIQYPGGLAGSHTLPSTVVKLADESFYGCANLTAFAIPDNVTSLGVNVFGNCGVLTSVTLGPGITSIPDGTFFDCPKLASITIPDNITSIGSNAFELCDLVNVSFPAGLTAIGSNAFYGNVRLTGVAIPASVSSIGGGPFEFCSSLTAITVDPQNPSYCSVGGVLFDKGQTMLLEYPGGLGGGYTIPSGVTAIVPNGFWGCQSLTSVTIPASVTIIDAGAFASCPLLAGVYFQGNAPSANSTLFDGDNLLATVYYLPGATGWTSTFAQKATTLESTPLSVPAITWAPPAAINYGTALSSVQLDASASQQGTFAYMPAARTAVNAGTYTLRVSFAPTDTSHYAPATATQTLTVNQTTPLLTWAAPAAISNGTALSSTQLDATANVPGTFVYAPDVGAVLAGGAQTLTVTFTPSDTANYTTATATETLTVIPFNYTTANGAITISGYTGSGGVVTIPSTVNGLPVTGIGDHAFASATGLTSITIPDGVTSIGTGAFGGCSSLANVTIPNTVTSIGDSAFLACDALTAITLPSSLASLGDDAFSFCSHLTDVLIPRSVTSIGNYVFTGCSDLTAIMVDPQNSSYSSLGGVLFDKSQTILVGYPPGLAGSYTIPASVTNIGANAFGGCTGLASVAIPDSVTNIGAGAFENCMGLTTVTIPNSVMSIGSDAFTACPNLTALTVNGQNAYYSSVNGVLFDKNQTTLIKYPEKLAGSYTIPNTVTNIGKSSFNGCSGLTGITIPEGVTDIADSAFHGCYRLSDVTIPDSVTTIGADVFIGCSGLSNVTIPAGVTSIGGMAFADCDWLTSITVNPQNGFYSSANGVLFDKSQTTLIQYPGGLVGSYSIPGTVTAIGPDAFLGCRSLASVTVPGSITNIGSEAFQLCLSLTRVYFQGNAPNADSTVFTGDQSLAVVYYATGTTGWGATFAGIPAMVLPPPTVPVITWEAPSAITYGTALYFGQLNATANVPGTFVYTPAAGTILTGGAQTLSVTFTPTDTADYTAATATQTLMVNQASPVISWATPSAIRYGAVLSSTQLNATANMPGTFVYSPAAGAILSPGVQTLSVTFTPTDTTDYAGTTAAQTVMVGFPATLANDVLTNRFTAGWGAVNGATDYHLNIYTNSGLTVFVPGYQNLDVGAAKTAVVSGLNPATTYYYEVDAYNSAGTLISSSSTITVTTSPPIAIAEPLIVSTVAGKVLTVGNSDGTGTAAEFNYPLGVSFASGNTGSIYIADSGNATIRRIQVSNGGVTTIAGQPGTSSVTFQDPSSVAVDSSGNIYVADTMNNAIRKIASSGAITTLAGNVGAAGASDGIGIAAAFNRPQGIAADSSGNLYVADTNNCMIRKIVASTGAVSTLAGEAGVTGSADGAGTAAMFNYPSALAVDTSGNVYVADTENHTIRAITPAGLVTTVAGIAGSSGCADGVGKAAQFNSPSALAVDTTSGNLYVADTDNFTIRMVVPSTGVVTTLAGIVGTSGSTDGSGSTALFYSPSGIATDSSGNLFIADTDNHTIRLGAMPAVPTIQTQPQSQTVTAGSLASFSITAVGRPAPTYQWYYGGTAISGATGTAYSISNAQSANAGDYTVMASNAMGSATSNRATLTVNAAPPPPNNGGGDTGGGGGGAPSQWFVLALVLIAIVRATTRMSRHSSQTR